MKKKIAIVLPLLICLLFASCGDGGMAIMNYMGFDTTDYENEVVVAVHENDSDTALELAELTRILSMNLPQLKPFSGADQAAELYRDSILDYILSKNYSKYTGNPALIEKAAAKYPEYQITTLIPKTDFESTVYTYFGGKEKVKNADGNTFKYLSKVEGYTTVSQARENDQIITVVALCETENTFRLEFCNTSGDYTSPVYKAVIIKREDGSRYIKSLAETTEGRISAPSNSP